jgi:hypothetical protein
MLTKKEILTRINSRVRADQKKFLKAEAKRLKIGEGELHRKIVDFYMSKNK